MTERSIVDAAARLRRRNEPHLIATVVNVQGSAVRRPGARMLLTQFRWIAGSVSGGCLEGDLSNRGWLLTSNGAPALISFDNAIGDDDIRSAFGLGGDAVVDVLLERAGAPGQLDVLELAEQCRRYQKRAAVVTVFRSEDPDIAVGTRVAVRAGEELGDCPRLREAMLADARIAVEIGESFNRSYATSAGTVDAFVEVILPPPRVFVFGTGHDAVPVVQLARALGWDVSICTHEARESTRQRFMTADECLVGTPSDFAQRMDQCDRAVAIVMGHNYAQDRDYLGMVLGSCARYVGVLASKACTAKMLAELGRTLDPRIHTPGLELGAETPEEIALAIFADVQRALKAPPPAKREVNHGRPTTDLFAVA